MPEVTPIRQVIHDMRNCVNVISMTARAMSMHRADEPRFEESGELLRNQVRELTELLKQADELTVGK